ncbi:MAG: ABC transporter substrate-binding protein [Elusimicrobia bacterium]|nr:ABC transporter substrate-binding protein [Elusimicrobiota bacterium]
MKTTVFLLLLCGMAAAETIHVPLVSIPKEISPAKTLDLSSAIIVNHLFEGLFSYDPSNKLTPNIVESFTISPDGKTYTLRLKAGLKFSNGAAVTAALVKRSIEDSISILGEASKWAFGTLEGYGSFIGGKTFSISGIMVKGERVVDLKLMTPYSPILQVFVGPYFKIALKENGKYFGTGPYRISGKTDSEISLKLLPWRKAETGIDEIVFSKVDSRKEMISPGNLKKYDVIEVLSAWKIKTERHNEIEFPYLQANLILFNTQRGVFRGRAARNSFYKMLRKSIDFKWFGWQPTAVGFPFANNLFKDPPETLEKHIFKTPVTVYYTDSVATFNDAGIQRLKEKLRQYGAEAVFTKIPISELLAKFKTLDFDAALLGYVPDIIDPDGLFFPLLGSRQQFNFTGYSSPQVDRLLQQGRSETDVRKRFAVYQELTSRVYEDCPVGFLGATHGRLLVSKKFAPPHVNSLGIFGFQLNTLKTTEKTR